MTACARCSHCGEAQRQSEMAHDRLLCTSCGRPFVPREAPPGPLFSDPLIDLLAPYVPVEEGTDARRPAAPAAAGPMPERIGRFELRAALGQGGFGRVYRAYDPQLDREVALKVPRLAPEQPEQAERFL